MSNMFLLTTGSKKDNLLLTWPKTACVKVLSDFFEDEKTTCEPVCFIKAEASPEPDSQGNLSLKLSGSLTPLS